ncbi:HutD family protein [Permianibacter sp. IMCC34836]|uniref:HutD/Ves family protein n=1 Tax=Permianibacter fluminis TaxID=2738515 RepID=UPI001557E291|nr:HutD family protein [Permianibacter fluminis]NQD36101.1 HutD family protein [Permianibacter fluminis]
MTVRILFPHHWQTQPWKNGGGITHELARADDAAGNRWRLSIAEVASDGPFSRFDNIDRVILMLTGKGFRLHGVGADPEVIGEPLRPFSFAGEANIHCTLVDGPVRDFNLMSRRADVAATLQVVALDSNRQSFRVEPQTFVFVASGRLFAELNGHGYVLDAEQTLMASDEHGDLQLSAVSADANALLVTIR